MAAYRVFFIAYCLAYFLIGSIRPLLGSALSTFAEQAQVELTDTVWLLLFRSLGNMLAALVLGLLIDRWLGQRILAALLFITALSTFMLPYATIYVLLVLSIIAVGVGTMGVNLSVNTLTANIYQNRMGPYISLIHFNFGLGAMCSPVLAANFLAFGYRITDVFMVLGLLSLVLAAWLWLGPQPLLKRPSSKQPSLATPSRPPSRPPKALNRERHYWLVGGVLFFIIYSAAEFSLNDLFVLFGQKWQLPTQQTAYAVASFWAAMTGSRLITAALLLRITPDLMAKLALGFSVVAVSSLMGFQGHYLGLSIHAAAIGFCLGPVVPCLFTLLQQKLSLTGKITAALTIGGTAGAAVAPALLGQLILNQEVFVFPVVLMGLFLSNFILLVVLKKLKNHQT